MWVERLVSWTYGREVISELEGTTKATEEYITHLTNKKRVRFREAAIRIKTSKGLVTKTSHGGLMEGLLFRGFVEQFCSFFFFFLT